MVKNSLQSLDRLLNAETIAVIGSVKRGKIAHQILTQLEAGGYSGNLWAVNPKAESPEGIGKLRAVMSVKGIHGKVDAAIICAPARRVASVLQECGQKGVPVGVIITSGFSETGRRDEEEELKNIAESYDMRLIGPNCAGIMNPHANIFASIEVRALPGDVAFFTQSGAVGGAVLAMAEERGIGFSAFVSFGNRVDIGELELLDYFARDPQTRAVAVYVESLRDGTAFMERAARIGVEKPIILIKAGRTASGARAAGSHTGSFAGSEEVFTAMVRQTGIIRVEGIEEMLDIAGCISSIPAIEGKRIAVITNSGGPGILTSDRAEQLGLEVSEPHEETKETLRAFLPPHSSVSNPIDLTVEGSADDFRSSIKTTLADHYDAAVAINVATPFLDSSDIAAGIADGADRSRKPVAAVFMSGRIVESGLEVLRRRDISSFLTGERAVKVIALLADYYERREKLVSQRKPGAMEDTAEGESATAPDYNDRGPDIRLHAPVLLHEAADFLRNRGFPLPEYRFADSAEAVRRVSTELEAPMVMKAVSPEIVHKSDVGGVVLNLSGSEEAIAAYTNMREKFHRMDFRGVFIHEMIPEGAEVILGLKRDPVFGPVVIAGAGGVYTELLRDVSLRIAPFSRETARDMLGELRMYRLLSGFRGKPTLAVDALVDLVLLLSELAMEHTEIRELDLNPVFVHEHRVMIGDIHIVTGTGD